MPYPRVPWTQMRAGLAARTRGATVAEAAVVAGCSERTLLRRLAEEPVVVVRERRQRPGALTLEERFEIQVGIRTNEADAVIGKRIGRHRSIVWRDIRANGGRDRYNASRAQARAALCWVARSSKSTRFQPRH